MSMPSERTPFLMEDMMNQAIVSPQSEQMLNSTEEEEHKTFSRKGPFSVMLEIVDPNTRKIRAFVTRSTAVWRAFPPRRKRTIALISGSALLAVTMSLFAAGMARRITRRRGVKTAPSGR